MNDKEFSDNIHMEVHAVRRIDDYKASKMDIHISKLVIEHFKDNCKECMEVYKKNKERKPEEDSMLNKFGNFIKN